MVPGVSSYSFKNYTGGAAPIGDVIKKAGEIGFKQIEFVDFKPPEGQCVFEYAANVRELCAGAGLTIAAYTCGADFISGSGGDQKKEANRVKGLVDVAAALGAPNLRHDSTYGAGRLTYMQAADKIAPYIREVTEYAESKGVRTMTENHGHFMQESYRMEYLISKVNHPNYGALIDIGNFICADEDPAVAVGRLAPFAFHVHAKDFKYKKYSSGAPEEGWGRTRGGNHIVGTIVGRGDMPVMQCLKILKSAGYDGGLGLEFEGREDNMTALTEGYEFLVKAIAELNK